MVVKIPAGMGAKLKFVVEVILQADWTGKFACNVDVALPCA
jgi:hypothetical protein